MKTIGYNEPPLAEVVPAPPDDRPVKCLDGSKSAEPGESLAQENQRLTRENARLRQDYDLLRTLIDSLPDRIFIKDRQSRFLVNNPAHVRAMGATTQDEVIGKTDLDIFPAELARQYYNDERAVMESGQPLNREEKAVNPRTNETRWLQTTKVPLRDKQQAVVGLMGISRDITELKRTEEAMAGAHLLLQAILDNVPDRIYFKDTQSRFLKLSKTLANRLGVKDPEEAVGKTDFDFNPREKAEEFYQDEQRIIRTGEALVNKTERQILPNGEIAWTSTTKVPLRDKAGKVAGIAGINRDITEQKRTEEALRQSRDELEKRVAERTAELSERNVALQQQIAERERAEEALVRAQQLLQAMLDNVPDRIYFKDSQSRFLKLSQALAKRIGVADPEQAVGKTDFDFFPPDKAQEFFQDEQKIIQTGQPLINKIEAQTQPGGEVTWASVTKVPLRDAAGKVIGVAGINRDITQQKHAEEALAQERRLLRTLIDNLPDAVYIKDTEGRKTLVNLADLKNVRCKTEAEAIGKSDFDLFSKDDAEKFWADDQKVIHGQPVLNREEKFLDEAGQEHWLLTSKLPLRDQNGKITGLVGIGRDITESKRVEAKLAYEKELFHTLLDTIPDDIYFKDCQSHLVRASRSKVESTFQTVRCSYRAAHPAADASEWPAHLAGVKAFGEWLIGKTDFDTYPEAHARAAYDDEQEIIRTGRPIVGKLQRVKLPDGTGVWWLSTKMPWRDRDGNIVGTFGVSKDVTAIKETEGALARERLLLRTLIDNLPDSIYAKDAACRKTLANPADLKNLRCKTEAEAIGKTDFDLFPKDIAEKFWADDQKVIQGYPVLKREEFFFDEKGRKHWLLTSKLPLRDQSGKITGLVGIGSDITARKRAEDALRNSEEKLRQFTAQLERSNRELQDFAYVASHDLQEPLRKIVVFGERLKDQGAGKLDKESCDYLERMQKAASRMQTLINDLLSFSRVTTKARPFVQVDLAEVAREVLADLEGRIEQVKGRVEVETLPVIDAEALQMRQLLQNLIGNALKFRRPEAPPVVKVAAEIIAGPTPEGGTGMAKKLCRLTVSDNGIGFDEKYLDRIFNVFQRLHSRNEYEGTGMGLAIARKIAVFHRGDITAKSKPGSGATFIVTLPVTHPKELNNNEQNE